MTLQIHLDQCEKCYGRLVETLEGERVCSSCGLVSESNLVDQSMIYSEENTPVVGLGSKVYLKDHSEKSIDPNIRQVIARTANLHITNKTEAERIKERTDKRRSVVKAIELFNQALRDAQYRSTTQYEMNIKQLTDEINHAMKRHGNKLGYAFLAEHVISFISEKPNSKIFDITLLKNNRRRNLRHVSNLAGQGNQAGKHRDSYQKKGYCLICADLKDTSNHIPTHARFSGKHGDSATNHYEKHLEAKVITCTRPTFISRFCVFSEESTEPENIIVDCSRSRSKQNSEEIGICEKCWSTAKIMRVEYERSAGKQVGKIIQEIRAVHYEDGKKKICYISSRIKKQKP